MKAPARPQPLSASAKRQLGSLLPPRIGMSTGPTFYVAPWGSDAGGDGSADRPWRTPAKAFAEVPLGARIVARGGTYDLEGHDQQFTRSGSPEQVTTLESQPGERASFVNGRIYVTGSYLRLARFDLRDAPAALENGLKITGTASHVDVDGLLVTRSARSGVLFTGAPSHVQIWNTEILGCGTSSQFDHGIYVAALAGPAGSSVIANALVRNSSGYGLQIYPDAQSLVVTGATIDGHDAKSGIVIGGSSTGATSNARIVGVLLTNNADRAVRVNWEGTSGSGNVVSESLSFRNGASQDYEREPGVGFDRVLEDVDPQYADRAAGDFRLRPTSPARSLVSTGLGYLPATDFTGASRQAGCAGAFCGPT